MAIYYSIPQSNTHRYPMSTCVRMNEQTDGRGFAGGLVRNARNQQHSTLLKVYRKATDTFVKGVAKVNHASQEGTMIQEIISSLLYSYRRIAGESRHRGVWSVMFDI